MRSKGFDVLDVVGGFAAISVYAPNLTTSEAVSIALHYYVLKTVDARACMMFLYRCVPQ